MSIGVCKKTRDMSTFLVVGLGIKELEYLFSGSDFISSPFRYRFEDGK